MEISKSKLRYIKWHSAQDLHEDIKACVLEMRFIKDEEKFLEDLIKNYTLDLIGNDIYEKSKVAIRKLSTHRKNHMPLIKKLISHSNKLQFLLDEDEVPEEMNNYKDIHYLIMFEVLAYYAEFKKVKKEIFGLIKIIMKEGKRKRLLN